MLLNACSVCARQYEVGHLAPGERVRCACGQVLVVEYHAPRMLPRLCCSNCGAAVKSEAANCEHCEALLPRDARAQDAVCPECYARMPGTARFCPCCGVAIAPQVVKALEESRRCPRCKGRLHARELGKLRAIECGACAGVWLEPEHFEEMCRKAEEQELALRELGAGKANGAARAGGDAKYLPCVSCGELMHRRNFGGRSGVVVDTCKGHGIWLDGEELERVLEFVRSGGLAEQRQAEIERLRERAAAALPKASPGAWGGRPSRGAVLPDAFELLRSLLFDALI